MATATATVTGNPMERKEIAAADAGREEVYVLNHSGADVKLYSGSDVVPFDIVPGSPAHLAKSSVTGATAALAIQARCETGALSMSVTLVT